MSLNYNLDTRNDEENPTRGIYYRLSVERAGKSELGGNFHYDRYAADLRHYMKLGPILYLDMRFACGYLDADPKLLGGPLYTSGSFPHRYPVHKEFYAGGISTLRGYDYKELRGDRLLLANVEYRIGGGDLQALVFADAGDAWVDAERDYDLRSNVGVGFQESGGGFRVMVAKRLDDSGASPLWWVRLRRTF
jgi:outer membrane protein assembly factor BamA